MEFISPNRCVLAATPEQQVSAALMDMQRVGAQQLRKLCVCWTPQRLVGLTAPHCSGQIAQCTVLSNSSASVQLGHLQHAAGHVHRSLTTCFAAQAETLEAQSAAAPTELPGYDAQQIQAWPSAFASFVTPMLAVQLTGGETCRFCKVWILCASAQACILAALAHAACIIW